MKILLTGIDGYLGWPLALGISKKFKHFKIIGVDNLSRRKWVKECKATSAIPIKSMSQRIKSAKNLDLKIYFFKGDLTNTKFTENYLKNISSI